MDIVCTRCGEPWHTDHVLHDEPEAFERRGGRIDCCPACRGQEPKLPPSERARLAAIRELAETLGDDVDGLAGCLEVFGLL